MIERSVPKHTPMSRMLKLREVHETDHPAVFKVFGRDMEQEPYTIVVLDDPLKVICNCEAGRRLTPCWHSVLVLMFINGRLGGSYAGRERPPAGAQATPPEGISRAQQRARLRIVAPNAADG